MLSSYSKYHECYRSPLLNFFVLCQLKFLRGRSDNVTTGNAALRHPTLPNAATTQCKISCSNDASAPSVTGPPSLGYCTSSCNRRRRSARMQQTVSTRHVFKVRSGLKLPPIACKVRERARAGSYMCSLANVCHFVAGRSLFYVKKD